MKITHSAFMVLIGVSAIVLDFAQSGPGAGALRGILGGMSGRMGSSMQREAAMPADMQLRREMVAKHHQPNVW